MKGSIKPEDYDFNIADSISDTIVVGNVVEERIDGRCVIRVRNNIMARETLETLSPDGSISTITMPEVLAATDGTRADYANNSQYIFSDLELMPYTILRRVKTFRRP